MIEIGSLVILKGPDNELYKVEQIVNRERQLVRIRCVSTDATTDVDINNLIKLNHSDLLKMQESIKARAEDANNDVADDPITEEQWALAQDRFNVFKRFIHGDVDLKTKEDVMAELKISRSTFYTLHDQFDEEIGIASMVVNAKGRKKGCTLLSEDQEDAIFYCYNTYAVKGWTYNYLHSKLQAECHKREIPHPSLSVMRKRIMLIPANDREAKKKGDPTAKDKYANRKVRRLSRALQELQLDHTLADIFLRSEEDDKPIGRPYLSLAVCTYTGVIVGFHLSFDAYQADAVALFEEIIQRESSLLAQVSTNWVEDFADDLPLDCCASLLRAYEGVPEEVQAKVIAYFDTGFTASTLPDRFGELYAHAASNIPRKSWDSGQLHDHLDRSLSRLPSRVSRSVEDLEALMGGLSKIYLHGSPATIATCLRDTFSTAASYPAQHNQLHLSLAGKWPSTDVVQPGYVPDTIFAEAINVGRRSPNEARRGLLCSLDSMLASGVVGHEREVELIELACLIWQTHPIEAQQFLMSKSRKLAPSQIAQLSGAISWESTEEVGWLKGAWEKAVPALDTSERTATTLLVLALGAVGSAKLPDQALSLWISCLGVGSYQVLVQALLSSDTTDDGRRRLWRQVASLKPAPAPDELITLSVRILSLATAPETAAAVNNDLESICNRLSDQESRLTTSKLLLATISSCSSVTIKTNLARLAFTLGTHAALSEVDESTLSEDDLQIIGDVFGKGRELTKLRLRFEKKERS